MSRSRKGTKPPGWDYWGKRPLMLGAYSRKATNKRKSKRTGIQRERAILKRELLKIKGQYVSRTRNSPGEDGTNET